MSNKEIAKDSANVVRQFYVRHGKDHQNLRGLLGAIIGFWIQDGVPRDGIIGLLEQEVIPMLKRGGLN